MLNHFNGADSHEDWRCKEKKSYWTWHRSNCRMHRRCQKVLDIGDAFDWCGTTSAVYGQGKLSILQILEKSKAAREEADVFLQKNISPEAVCGARRKIFVMLYGGKSSTDVKPVSLPPTKRAALFQIYRTYFH